MALAAPVEPASFFSALYGGRTIEAIMQAALHIGSTPHAALLLEACSATTCVCFENDPLQ